MNPSQRTSLPDLRDDETVPLDDRLKRAQLHKLVREMEELRKSKWDFDAISKILISVLAAATAIWAFVLGLPQARMETYEAQQKLSDAQSELQRKGSQLTAIEAHLDSVKAAVAKLENQRKLNQESINDLEALKISTAADVKRLQELLLKLKTDDPALKAAVTAATRQGIFIQFAGSLERQEIDSLRRDLNKAGFDTPPAVRRNSGQSNGIRYLSSLPNGAALAGEAGKVVEEHFRRAGCPLPGLAVERVESAGSSGVPIEVLLLHNCRSR